MSNFLIKWKWLLVMAAAAMVAFAPLPGASPAPTDRHFHIKASSYEYLPAVIHANRGDVITISLSSTDVVHGLYIDGYDLSVESDPGQTRSIRFTANQAGAFRLRCSVTCGALHPFMIGKLVVGSNSLLWRAGGLALLASLAVLSVRLRR